MKIFVFVGSLCLMVLPSIGNKAKELSSLILRKKYSDINNFILGYLLVHPICI